MADLAKARRQHRFLERLFDSRPDPRRITNDADVIGGLLGMIRGDEIAVELKRIPAGICRRVRRRGHIDPTRTESGPHLFMKACAVEAMHEVGYADARAEVSFGFGWRADAYSEAGNCIIECGNTPIWKVHRALGWDDEPRFMLMPFQAGADCWRSGECQSLLMVEFYRPDMPAPASRTPEAAAL